MIYALSKYKKNITIFHLKIIILKNRSILHRCAIVMCIFPSSGYAGRTELPDNLKSMFRPIAMVTPDSNLIAEIILFGEGFGNTKVMAVHLPLLTSCLANTVNYLSAHNTKDSSFKCIILI